MDQYIINFIKELGANLFLVKNFYFLVESYINGLSSIQSCDFFKFTAMGYFSFWQKASSYFKELNNKKNVHSIYHFISYLDSHPELIPENKRNYFSSLSLKVKRFDKSDSIKTYSMDNLFDDIIFSHQIYVGLSNLYSIPQADQSLSFKTLEHQYS